MMDSDEGANQYDETNDHDVSGSEADIDGALYARLCTLVHKCLSQEALPAEIDALERLVCDDPQARAIYVGLMHQTRALRRWAAADAREGDPPPTRSVSEEDIWETDESSLTLRDSVPHIPHSSSHISRLAFHPITLVALAAIAIIGTLAYTFSSKRTDPPVAAPKAAESFEPAATLVRSTDAQWMGPFALAQGALRPGQRLILERGFAEITFSSQARVIFEGPADFTIVDAMACRLSSGKLTAHVPGSAKGFTVHTPEGSVKDLGTEFGVVVKTGNDDVAAEGEQEQPAAPPQLEGRRQSVTEVHVFTGKVELAKHPSMLPKSQIGAPATAGHPKSKILSAGQAVTISDNKVQPLPAADPFKFSLNKLHGKATQVVRTDGVKGPQPASSATITFVATGGNPDVTTKGAWRTSTVAKPLDADRDNVYGSDGYFMPTSGSATPHYLQTLGLPLGTLSYGGDPAYAQIDNPSSPPGRMPSQLFYRTPASPAANLVSFTISGSLAGSKSFRVGILVDQQGHASLDASGISPNSLRIHQIAGGAATSPTINGARAAVANRAEPHWYFFDVVGAVANQQFAIEVGGSGAFGNQVGIGGLTFDSLPAETVPKK